jgi:hypothetical protein
MPKNVSEQPNANPQQKGAGHDGKNASPNIPAAQGPRQGDSPDHGPSESHRGNPQSTRAARPTSGRSGSDSNRGK